MNCLIVALSAIVCSATLAGPNEDLFKAIEAGSVERVEDAIDAGADVNASQATVEGHQRTTNSPLQSSLALDDSAQRLTIIKKLLEAGADINKPFSADMTCMHWYFQNSLSGPTASDPVLLMYLLDAGGKLDALDALGRTPFQIACQLSDQKSLLLCIASLDGNFESIDTVTRSGWTSAMLTASSNDPSWLAYWIAEIQFMHPGNNEDEASLKQQKGSAQFMGGMLAQYTDAQCPSAKLWLLMRHGLCDVDAETEDGMTLDSLLEHRSDPESRIMRRMITLYRENPSAIGVPFAYGINREAFPIPESIARYFEINAQE